MLAGCLFTTENTEDTGIFNFRFLGKAYFYVK